MTNDESILFDGVLAYLDIPSDSVPDGARGHKVMLTRLAAEEALPSLCGKSLKYGRHLECHNGGETIGLITHAKIEYKKLKVSGIIFPGFQHIANILRSYGEELGMSYEICNALVSDITKEVWVLERVTFFGAAILLKSKAAYKNTSIILR